MIKSINQYLLSILLVTIAPFSNAMEAEKKELTIQEHSYFEILPTEILSQILEYAIYSADRESENNVNLDKALKALYLINHLTNHLTHTKPLRKIALSLLVDKTKQLKKYKEMSKWITENGGVFELFMKIREGCIEKVRSLLLGGISLNSQFFGETPLNAAIRSKQKDIVRLLLEAGANVNAKGNNDQTPLIIAIHAEELDIISMLINADADINLQDYGETTPLIAALCHPGALVNNIVRIILDAKPDVNKQDCFGYTALAWSAHFNEKESAQMLLDAQANVDIQNGDGKTALIIAEEKEHIEIAEIIEKATKAKKNKATQDE